MSSRYTKICLITALSLGSTIAVPSLAAEATPDLTHTTSLSTFKPYAETSDNDSGYVAGTIAFESTQRAELAAWQPEDQDKEYQAYEGKTLPWLVEAKPAKQPELQRMAAVTPEPESRAAQTHEVKLINHVPVSAPVPETDSVDEPMEDIVVEPVAVYESQPEPEENGVEMAFGDSVSNSELDGYRGASSFSVADDVNLNLLDAINANNTSNNSVTGNNVINASAFQNTSGLVNLIQNSGNNVIIQSATIVNLNLK